MKDGLNSASVSLKSGGLSTDKRYLISGSPPPPPASLVLPLASRDLRRYTCLVVPSFSLLNSILFNVDEMKLPEYEKLSEPGCRRHRFCVYLLAFALPVAALLVLAFNNFALVNVHTEIFLLVDDREDAGIGEFEWRPPFTPMEILGKIRLDRNGSEENLPPPPAASSAACLSGSSVKVDCLPRGKVSKESCDALGCCYAKSAGLEPSCFYPSGYSSYIVKAVENRGNKIDIKFVAKFKSPYPATVGNLSAYFYFLANNSVVFRLGEAQLDFDEMEFSQVTPETALYAVNVSVNATGFQIIRKSNKAVLFDMNIGALLAAEQYLQFSTRLPSLYLYGLGDSVDDFPLNLKYKTKTFFTHDTVPSQKNGYSYLPAYLCVENDGKAHHVIINTITASDFTLQPGVLTVRTIQSANVQVYITLGDSPLDAVTSAQANYNIPPYMPPYWSLGFHLSRLGYKNISHAVSILTALRVNKIPIDTQWFDIDYMDNHNDFTIGKNFKEMPNAVKYLHSQNMRAVLILDPGVSASEPRGSYPPYDAGLKQDVFIKDYTGKKPLIGKVWNRNSTVFVDFYAKNVLKYWTNMLKDLHDKVPFDGIWIDMNEPSNFVNGSVHGCLGDSRLENPPYVPNVDGGSLRYRTICMSARHSPNLPHYLLHNLYGAAELEVTKQALTYILKKRPFVISRSANLYSIGHWTGDVYSSWEAMAQSVKDLLNYSIFGISMVGADICGFNGNTTKELCRRWSQLGAFYPFSRNHNTDNGIPQDPVSMGIEASTREALMLRYSLLPYLYTLFWEKSLFSLPVVRPTFFLFPHVKETYNISNQFLLGESLLVVPVLQPSFTYVKAYLGDKVWYDLRTNMLLKSKNVTILAAPEDTIPILLLGGRVLPMQKPSVTTYQTRMNDMFLKVALNKEQQAVGNIYLDDGESLNPVFSTVGWYAYADRLESKVEFSDYKTDVRVKRIEVFSLTKVDNVTVDGRKCDFTYNQTSNVLYVDVDVPVVSDYTVMWK
ncbi:lysosomal alpha-glucosidase-like [Cimex lectularius]|uniref:P-type domain-containing protein n=1 Tax=Cimex lectularius TaxID=79782 RepID=A0A8I6RGT7_CIMLE|nr:lysosomal alpha-glucosidase-like [Cimex lectularius]